MKDLFTFGKEPEIDGSIPVLKNGERALCPKASLIGYQTELGAVKYTRMACNKSCPFLNQAEKKLKDDDKVIPGYVLNCTERPIFIEISEQKSNNLIIQK